MTNQPTGSCKPASLDEAHAALLNILSTEQIEKLKSRPDDVMLYHHGLGTFIRNEWIRHGKLGRLFSSFKPISIDAMSALILESFVAKLCGRRFDFENRAAEEVAAERDYYLSMIPPNAVSPTSGSTIRWIAVKGQGPGAVHTGFDPSDGTYWRWIYGGKGYVEPATPEEAASLRSSGWGAVV